VLSQIEFVFFFEVWIVVIGIDEVVQTLDAVKPVKQSHGAVIAAPVAELDEALLPCKFSKFVF